MAGVALLTCAVMAAPAIGAPTFPTIVPAPDLNEPTSATIAPSLSPDRLHAKAALTMTIRYAGGELGVPAPVRRSVLHLPAGLTLNIPHLVSCSARRLRAHGAGACPAQSKIGTGHALTEVRLGAVKLTENITLTAFLGPPRNLQPTVEVFAQGYSPLDEKVVFNGETLSDHPPYGEEMVLFLPPIPTLPLEPEASIVSFTLQIGASSSRRAGRRANTVIVPASCPAGGFPFGAEFTYADGSSGSALATVPCPGEVHR